MYNAGAYERIRSFVLSMRAPLPRFSLFSVIFYPCQNYIGTFIRSPDNISISYKYSIDTLNKRKPATIGSTKSKTLQIIINGGGGGFSRERGIAPLFPRVSRMQPRSGNASPSWEVSKHQTTGRRRDPKFVGQIATRRWRVRLYAHTHTHQRHTYYISWRV